MNNLRARFNELKGKKDLLEKQLTDKKQVLIEIEILYENLLKARWIITEVAKETQTLFKKKVESLVTLAIQGVFDRPFIFELEFDRKRNRFECQPVVKEGDDRYVPKHDMGGSILDIIGFAFRVVLWSLENPRSRNVFILDEPMKWTGNLIYLAGKIIKEISSELFLQIILVTHDEALKEIGDRVWRCTYNNGKSMIVQER